MLARRRLITVLAGAIALAGLITPVSVGAAAVEPDADDLPDRWSRAIATLATDPDRATRELRRLARRDGMPAEPRALVALGYAFERARRPTAARQAFLQAADRDVDDVWTARALLALGWSALVARDPDAATRHFAAAAEGPSDSAAALGRLMVERVESAYGLGASFARLTQLAEDPAASRDLRVAAQLELAYAYYWNGSYTAAADAFETLAARAPDSVVFDDAEYGSALARWANGDATGARQRWAKLADDSAAPARIGAARRRMSMQLDARLLTARLARRARDLAPGEAEASVLSLYDQDGSALARAALEVLASERTPHIAPRRADDRSLLSISSARSDVVRDREPLASSTSDDDRVVLLELAVESGIVAAVIGAVVLIIGHGAGSRRRARARPPQRRTPSAASAVISSSERPRMFR